jgi:hypothetical protein
MLTILKPNHLTAELASLLVVMLMVVGLRDYPSTPNRTVIVAGPTNSTGMFEPHDMGGRPDGAGLPGEPDGDRSLAYAPLGADCRVRYGRAYRQLTFPNPQPTPGVCRIH